ncbi:MAG: hypothetical protein EBV03_03310 [Proteobacteria bacterium]|nr:hypothetical protein [Pseudomonadota bacterium]
MAFFRNILMGAALLSALAAGSAQAATLSSAKDDALVEGALQCTRHFPRYEREYGIPTHLLSAIASTESGRYHNGLKIMLPWPWTVTNGTNGQYYDTKEQAIAAVNRLRAAGIKNIDVGCMQVNLQHHGDAFANLEQAFEPASNIAYAATFLRRLYDDSHAWKTAASNYHSKTPSLGNKYIGRVYDHWYGIIQKLREARLAVPGSSVAALNEMKKPNQQASAKLEPYPAQGEAQAKVYTPPHFKTIKVSQAQDNATVPQALTYTRRQVDKDGIIVVNNSLPVQNNTGPAVVAPAAAPPVSVPASAPAIAPATMTPAITVTPKDEARVAAPAQAVTASAALTPTQPTAAPAPVQVTASVSAPLNTVTQAAVMPVSGLVNTALRETQVAYVAQQPTPAPIPAAEPVDYQARRPLEAPEPARAGPRFIFSE